MDYYKVARNIEPHAPYYLSKTPADEGPGVPIKEKWILSPDRRFKLYDSRIFRVIKPEDGAVLVECENPEPHQRAKIKFNRAMFHNLIEEELAPAE